MIVSDMIDFIKAISFSETTHISTRASCYIYKFLLLNPLTVTDKYWSKIDTVFKLVLTLDF